MKRLITFPCGNDAPQFTIYRDKTKPVEFTFQQKPSLISRDNAAEILKALRKELCGR